MKYRWAEGDAGHLSGEVYLAKGDKVKARKQLNSAVQILFFLYQFEKYLCAYLINTGQFGPTVWPPACCLKAISPSTNEV